MAASPQDVIQKAMQDHDQITISFSGAEDVVLIDMACQLSEDVNVFCLDTGRLHAETYQFIEQVREHYGIEIDVISPDGEAVAAFVKEKGLYSFYEDGHQECCSVRKIEPLRRHLENWDAWITGQRKDQSPTRSEVETSELDKAFSTNEHPIAKYNPLANWTSAQVWQYIRENDVPYNSLHDRGYLSIGCEPCTRAIKPNEHERAGRWWWEEATQKECGLHVIKVEEA